jgi:F-type H+-transporting ATPase subunit b
MKSLLALLMLAGALALAQEPAKETKEEAKSESEDSLKIWKWANFAILAGAIGYAAAKNAGPMFAARSEKIRKDMIEADEVRRQAEERAVAVDRRLANLETEIAALRDESRREAEAERQRVAQHIAAEIGKIQQHAEQEIDAAGKAARLELKRYAAELAIGLAERRIRDRMTPPKQDALVNGFVRHLQ